MVCPDLELLVNFLLGFEKTFKERHTGPHVSVKCALCASVAVNSIAICKWTFQKITNQKGTCNYRSTFSLFKNFLGGLKNKDCFPDEEHTTVMTQSDSKFPDQPTPGKKKIIQAGSWGATVSWLPVASVKQIPFRKCDFSSSFPLFIKKKIHCGGIWGKFQNWAKYALCASISTSIKVVRIKYFGICVLLRVVSAITQRSTNICWYH